jgi:hypothetical protein
MELASRKISTWDDLTQVVSRNEGNWIYRGQTGDWRLRTTIERALLRWGYDLEKGPAVEYQTIREFRRRLKHPNYQQVQKDTLYCLALMQHHGAPTRLLDCTYSPYVAAAFAMEEGKFRITDGEQTVPIIWCFNADWLQKETAKINGLNNRIINKRRDDCLRNDDTFLPLYKMRPSDWAHSTRFVCNENPLELNERLSIQQGVFLCPGDLRSSFLANLRAMNGWKSDKFILKLRLVLSPAEAAKFALNLKRMNLSCTALFPGLDGFARSIGQELFHYYDLAERQTGLLDH